MDVTATIVVTVLSTLFGSAVGGLVTWLVAKHYYENASEDLTAEAQELRRLTVLLIRALEESDVIDVVWDANHTAPTGIVISVSASGSIASSGRMTAEVIRSIPPETPATP